MEQLDFNIILQRENLANEIKDILKDFEKNKKDLSIKRGIYIYGSPGSGKTYFVYKLLEKIGYDIINYDAGDVRNKSIIDTITQNNMTDTNVLSLLKKNNKPIAIVMDEIDGMNNGDKGGINSLIKVIRPKKTKKQKQEEAVYIPIICIGNYHIDKKINELIKVCHSFPFSSPTSNQIYNIINLAMPNINSNDISNILNYIQNDLRKLASLYQIYKKQPDIINNKYLLNIFQSKSTNEDTKETTKKIINNHYTIQHHNVLMNETDRTIVGLLWHENIIDPLNKINMKESIPLYIKLLDNICYADYIDRITFQKQIWQFNEMSSLIKLFYNNHIFHNSKIENSGPKLKNSEPKYYIQNIRFTKVLTKYSTEYNNSIFIQNLCQILNLDKKDLFSLFIKIKDLYLSGEIYPLFEQYEITKLDINRIYRYIDKYTLYNCVDDSEL